jgi:hypothetical protein
MEEGEFFAIETFGSTGALIRGTIRELCLCSLHSALAIHLAHD